MPKKSPASEQPFLRALRAYFPVKKYVLLPQVEIPFADGIRYADALVLGLWKSFNSAIQGFEIKATRADWLQELRNPSKVEETASYCDGWSVLSYQGVILLDEIPERWGMYQLEAGHIVEVRAPKLQDPRPLDRAILSLLANAIQKHAALNVELLSSESEYQRGYENGKAEGFRKAEAASEYLTDRLAQSIRSQDALNVSLKILGIDSQDKEHIECLREISMAIRRFGQHRRKDVLEALHLLTTASPQRMIQQFQGLQEGAAALGSSAAIAVEKIKSLFETKEGSTEQ